MERQTFHPAVPDTDKHTEEEEEDEEEGGTGWHGPDSSFDRLSRL